MLHITMGHQLDTLTYLLWDFACVSATTALHYSNPTIIGADGKSTDKTFPAETPDQVAFTGILKSGAISSIIWRGGYSSTKGREQLVWTIDGEEGSISMKSDDLAGAFVNIRDSKVYLNGELVALEAGSSGGLINNLTNAWSEYAKGESGKYATMEDPVRNHRLIDAIERSAMEGRRIVLE
jgi:predicted dehydrogenase